MSEGDLKGRIDLDVSGATNALEKARKAFRDLSAASTEAGKEMSVAQVRAAKQIIASYESLRKEQSKVVNDAIALNRKLKEIELKGVTDRAATRAKTATGTEVGTAKVASITSGTADKSLVAAGQSELLGAKRITEERRQQVMLADAAARRSQEGIKNELAMRKQVFREQQAALAMQDRQNGSLSGMRYAISDVSRGFALMGAGAIAASVAVLGISVSWEKSFAEVLRTNSKLGDTALQAKYLKEQFTNLVTTLPVSWEKLTEIGTLAGQLGIAKSHIADFTKNTAMFAATTDVSVDATATAFGRLDSLLPSVKGNYQGLADAVLKVGVNSVATESQIIKITTQLASIAGPVGYTYQQVIGLSGALASVGAPAELSRGTLQRTFGNIGRAISDNGVQLDKWGLAMGMSGQEFKKAWTEDASGTFVKFMGKIETAGASADNILRELGITSVRDVPLLKRLAMAQDKNGDSFDAATGKGGLLIQTMNDAAHATGELARQYAIISGTSGAKLQVLFQNVQAALDKIGSTQLGSLSGVISDITAGIQDFSDSLDENVRIFDIFELGMTNAEFAGGAAVVMGVVGALALAIAGLGQVAAGAMAMSQVVGAVRGHMNLASTSMSAMGGAADAAALSYGGLNSRFGSTGGFASKATSAFGKVGSAVTKMGSAIGPEFAAIAVFAASAYILDLAAQARQLGSDVGDMANNFTTAQGPLDLLLTTKVNKGGFLREDLGGFVKDLDTFKEGIKNLDGDGMWSDFRHSFEDIGKTGDDASFANITAGLDKLDAGYASLVASGNGDKAAAQMTGLITGAKLSSKEIDTLIERMPNYARQLKNTLSGQEMEASKENLRGLARGNSELKDAMLAAQGVSNTTVAENFNESSDEAIAFLGVVSASLAAAGDMGTAYQDTIDAVNAKGKQAWVAAGNDVSTYVDVATVTFSDYLATMDQLVVNQGEKAKNLALIAIRGGTDVAEAMATQSAEVIAAAAHSTEDEFTHLVGNLDLLSESARSTVTANIAAITPAVIASFTEMGGGSADEFIAAITRGDRTVQQILDDLRAGQAAKPVIVDADPALAKAKIEAFRQEDKAKPPLKTMVDADTTRARLGIDGWMSEYRGRNIPINVSLNTGAADAALAGLRDRAGRPINVGSFDGGGFTGPGSKMTPAGVVHKGEFVMTKKATEAIGVGNLYAMMGAAQRGYATGGQVSPSSNSYVHSNGPQARASSGGSGNGGVQIVDFSAQAIQALADALNLQVIIPGTAIAHATSANNVNSSNRRNA